MANGNPNFEEDELPELERFFAPIAATLEGFATRHNLQLVRYYHQSGSWNFYFRHADGGVGSIQVLRAGADDVLIVGHRHLSDYQTFRRRTYLWDLGQVSRSDARLRSLLQSLLKEMLALPVEELVPDGVDYSQYWRTDVLDTVRASQEELPLPVL